jgi:metal transporter CNNM
LVTSTIFILILGEILPQAVCGRYGLYVGYHTTPLVKFIMLIFYPVAKPIAVVLDCVLGQELATIYSSSELIKLLAIHVEEDALDHDVAKTMGGALRYKDMTVSAVMTPLENTFMLNVDEKLNFETVARIFKTGFSRIPVYEVTKNNVVGLLFVKDLIFIDPEDENRVRDFVEIMGRSFHLCWPDDKLGDVLKELKRGRSHMALVRDVIGEKSETDPYYVIKGIITLEDILEEIIGTFSNKCILSTVARTVSTN